MTNKKFLFKGNNSLKIRLVTNNNNELDLILIIIYQNRIFQLKPLTSSKFIKISIKSNIFLKYI